MEWERFDKLSLKKKAYLIYKDGIFMGKVMSGDRPAVIYSIYGFPVMITYLNYRLVINEITPYTEGNYKLMATFSPVDDFCKN